MDADHDGKISDSDLRTFYSSVSSVRHGHEDEDDMIKAMINVADSNKDGFVEYDEFEGVLNEGDNETIDGGVMEGLFKVMDRDGDGKLGFQDLKSYLELVGIRVSDDEIKSMILLGAGNVTDGVSFLDFLHILDLQF